MSAELQAMILSHLPLATPTAPQHKVNVVYGNDTGSSGVGANGPRIPTVEGRRYVATTPWGELTTPNACKTRRTQQQLAAGV